MIGGRGRPRLVAAAAILSVACVGARAACAQSNEELMRIIRDQQRQIDELSRKVAALSGQAAGAAPRTAEDDQPAEPATATATKVADQSNFNFQVGTGADDREQGWQLVGSPARPAVRRRRLSRRPGRVLQQRQRDRAARRPPRHRGHRLEGLRLSLRGRLRRRRRGDQGRLHRIRRRGDRAVPLCSRRPVQDTELAGGADQLAVHHLHGTGGDHQRVRTRPPDRPRQRRRRRQLGRGCRPLRPECRPAER